MYLATLINDQCYVCLLEDAYINREHKPVFMPLSARSRKRRLDT